MYYMWNKASNDNKVLQQTADSLCHDFLINRPKHAYKMTRTFALTKCSPAHDTKREEDLSRNKIAVASRTNDDNIAAVVTGQRALSKIFQISLWIINIILFQIFIFFLLHIFFYYGWISMHNIFSNLYYIVKQYCKYCQTITYLKIIILYLNFTLKINNWF